MFSYWASSIKEHQQSCILCHFANSAVWQCKLKSRFTNEIAQRSNEWQVVHIWSLKKSTKTRHSAIKILILPTRVIYIITEIDVNHGTVS